MTNFWEKAEPPKAPPVPQASGQAHGLKHWGVWALGEEAAVNVVVVPRYRRYPPELWVATHVGTLWSELGCGAGAASPEQRAGLVDSLHAASLWWPSHRNLGRLPASKGCPAFHFWSVLFFPPLL